MVTQTQQEALKAEAAEIWPSGTLCDTFSASCEGDELALNRSARIESDLELTVHQLAVGSQGADTIAGRRVGGGTANNSLAEQLRRDRSEKDSFDHVNRLLLLLDQELADIDANIAALRDKLDALEQAEALYYAGDLDPANPEHARILQRAGLTEDDISTPERAANAFGTGKEETTTELDEQQQRREHVQEARDEFGDTYNNQDLPSAEKLKKFERLQKERQDLIDEITRDQEEADNPEFEQESMEIQDTLSAEDEVSNIIQAKERGASIEELREMAKELSPDAAEIVSFEMPELFEEADSTVEPEANTEIAETVTPSTSGLPSPS